MTQFPSTLACAAAMPKPPPSDEANLFQRVTVRLLRDEEPGLRLERFRLVRSRRCR
jgi:hypothetical protein